MNIYTGDYLVQTLIRQIYELQNFVLKWVQTSKCIKIKDTLFDSNLRNYICHYYTDLSSAYYYKIHP